MTLHAARFPMLRAAAVLSIALLAGGLASCSAEISDVDRAQAQVDAKEKAVTDAESELTTASDEFCQASEAYIRALDRYGDVLNDTAPTVGDVRAAGADLAGPSEDALDGAAVAAQAQEDLTSAEQDLANARRTLAEAQAEASGTAAEPVPEPTTPAPLAPAASVERVTEAESEFASAQDAVTEDTPLTDASELFNSAAVALEMAWLRLFADAGCLTDDQQAQAVAAVSAYTMALQQNLADTGHYAGAIDGIYGPATVAAVEDVQNANGLPVTGTVDRATAEAIQTELLAVGGAAAQESLTTTAAIQQTLKLVGFWDGPVDGAWTPELTEAVKAFQVELGVEPTGNVDAATVAAFQQALTDLKQPGPEPSAEPSSEPSSEPEESPTP